MNVMTNAILMLLLLSRGIQLVMPSSSSSSSSSAERVHIKVHMPEFVRQPTHFYRLHKPAPPPPPLQLAKTLPAVLGKPRLALLGYTTSPVAAHGNMVHSLLQLLALQQPQPAVPLVAPPVQAAALFNKLNLLTEEVHTLNEPPMKQNSAQALSELKQSKQQSQPQQQQQPQLFTPQMQAAVSSNSSYESAPLTNNVADYFAALQQDLNKHKSTLDALSTVSDMLKRKKYVPMEAYQSSPTRPKSKPSNTNNYLYELADEEDFEEFAEPQHDEFAADVVDIADVNTSMAGIDGYSTGSTAPTAVDSAVAFSDSNAWTVGEWPPSSGSSNLQSATDADSIEDAYAFAEAEQDTGWQPTAADYVPYWSPTTAALPRYQKLKRWPKRHKAHGKKKRHRQSAPRRRRKIRLKLQKLHNIHDSLYYT